MDINRSLQYIVSNKRLKSMFLFGKLSQRFPGSPQVIGASKLKGCIPRRAAPAELPARQDDRSLQLRLCGRTDNSLLKEDKVLILEREAIRAILLTPEREVLLLRIKPPEGGDWFWIAPGGGLEPGETVEAGLRRELREELGLEQFVIGPLVWLRQHTFNWAEKRIRQREQYYIIHVPRFEPRMSDATEAKVLDRFHWWPVADLARTPERLTPLSLPQIVARYLMQGAPGKPLEVEDLVD
jgi:8-oxo-dGTP pyrophosphatase MutT (NUDIX family)